MHICRCPAPQAIRWAAALLAIFAMAAVAPARAAGDEDYKGWFLTLDAALTQPNGLDQRYGALLKLGSTGLATDILVIDNDSDFTGSLKFGYGFGDGLGRLQVSYWGFDNEDEATKPADTTGYLFPTVFGFGYYMIVMPIFPGPETDMTARSKVEAATLDVDYLRSYAVGKKTTVTWLAGLRSATYEESQDFTGTYTYAYYPYVQTYRQHKCLEANGIGLRLGASVKFGFTDHFGLEGGSTFSFLQAETEAKSWQSTSDGGRESRRADDDNVRGEMREFGLKACWSYGMMDYFVGYRMETWDGLVVDPLLWTGFNASTQGRDSVSFNSLHAGVTFKFGKD